ncbi:methyltransferase, partial [Ochrobactrum sp. SFR4]|nr:methyltransferase [Ochrobactrum sp. SFR4]
MPLLISDATRATQFILANTGIHHPPHVAEIALHLADEAHDLWHKTEEELS